MTAAVTVSMPYYRTPDTVRRAVRSVLDQTRSDLLLIVINDGDNPATIWKPLADIRDERLVRFDLAQNRGRYYCDAVTLAACGTPWWTVHDSDDWSDPDRHQAMLDASSDDVDVVFTGYIRYRRDGHVGGRRLPRMHLPGSQLHFVAPQCALWRTDALRAIGGPNPAWRIGWDTLMVSVAAAHLRCTRIGHCGYHATRRDGSLTTSGNTGMRSARRRATHIELGKLWQRVRRIPTDRVAAKLAAPAHLSNAVRTDAARLAEVLP